MLKAAILDDYQNVAMSMADWSPLAKDVEITVFNEPFADQQAAIKAVKAGEAVVNADGTELINLTNHASDDTRPDGSPDGTLIAFQSNRHGNPEIYVMHADGSDGANPVPSIKTV